MVMEWFAELLMNITRETVEPAMRAAADDVGGDYPDLVPNDTRNLMGFFISLRRLMMEVCWLFCTCMVMIFANMCDKTVWCQRFHIFGPNKTDA